MLEVFFRMTSDSNQTNIILHSTAKVSSSVFTLRLPAWVLSTPMVSPLMISSPVCKHRPTSKTITLDQMTLLLLLLLLLVHTGIATTLTVLLPFHEQ